MLLLEYILLFILGIIFGSFISAVSWRIPNGMSFVRGRSVCPNCRNNIRWYDNIPLLSYLVLGGKCRKCKEKISIRYPAIELATGLGFPAILYFIDVTGVITLVYILLMFLILLTIFIIDLEHQIIPDSLVFLGLFITLIYSLSINNYSLFIILFSGFLGASFLMFIHLITRGKGMGLGDVKFAVLGGMIMNLKLLPLWLLLSFLTGAIAGIILILSGKAKMKTKIAFGPFLILGIVLTFAFGNNIMNLLGLT
jgi:prepilin signal peptidase PulO-like enzyme (type II secretory pathway)